MKFRVLIFVPILLASITGSGQITYTNTIADLIYNKCTTCHRPGEIGPFSLTNYDEVAARAATIKYVTEVKYMPPWKADPNYQHYLDENYLTNEEITQIANWVDAGMPYGNVTEEPSLPNFPNGSAIGEPDLVLSFKEAHVHKGNNLDEYRYFVLPSGLTEDKKIKAIELRPGNSKIVHHALFFQDVTGKAAEFDAKTPEYGFLGTSGFDDDAVLTYDQYPGYVPGQRARYFPDGMAQTLSAGADLVIQMHYAPISTDESDSSSVNIFFADEHEVIDREVQDEIMLPFHLSGGFTSFFIPANQTRDFLGTWNITRDLSFLGVFPHMHLLGRSWEVWLERPDGSIENLIKIDDWDFNWQGGYYFTKFIIAPKGSKVRARAKYDNTVNNPYNPNNPPKFVSWGEKTTDEMYYFPILYVDYRAGDEDVVFDDETTDIKDVSSAVHTMALYPNPSANGLVNVEFNLDKAAAVSVNLLNAHGQLLRSVRKGEFYMPGKHFIHINAGGLRPGTYFVQMSDGTKTFTEKLLIVPSE